MDEFLTRLKATSRAEGKIEGEVKGQAKIIQNLINFGKLTVEQISAMINLPVEKVQELSTMNISAV